MLIATWILAGSTLVLAIGGPIAFLSWWKDRAEDRERRNRDRMLRDAADRFITKADAGEKFVAREDAGQKFATKDSVILVVLAVAAAGALAWNNLKGGADG